MIRTIYITLLFMLGLTLESCGCFGTTHSRSGVGPEEVQAQEEVAQETKPIRIEIRKALQYDRYTLADTYPYRDTTRQFQWDKIKEALRVVDSVQMEPAVWGLLRNRNNKYGTAPLVKRWSYNDYKNVADMWGVERRQGIPLYPPGDPVAERYARDGSWVKVLGEDTVTGIIRVEHIYNGQVWNVPAEYVKTLTGNTGKGFYKVVLVDRTNQHIASIEKVGNEWLVRSMNPATTGAHNPPYAHPTPLGYFVIQEKKVKMIYTHDGSDEYAGYAPWASRFSNGGYLHGVPTNNVQGAIIEYSQSLGTTPRSHMCVRNASSHAKFLYDWAPVEQSLVIVIE